MRSRDESAFSDRGVRLEPFLIFHFGLAVLLRSIPESWYQAPAVSDATAGTLAWFDSVQFAHSCNPPREGIRVFPLRRRSVRHPIGSRACPVPHG